MIIFHQNNEGDKKIALPQLIQKVILILWLSWTAYINYLGHHYTNYYLIYSLQLITLPFTFT